MKTIFVLICILGFVITSGCHAHKADKVVVLKKSQHSKGQHNNKIILVDNDHKRKNYRIVHVKPKPRSACSKHKKHWHCH